MTFTNLSEIIHPECEIIGNDGTHWTVADIQNGVNYWKQKLYTALDGKTVGKTVWISTSTFYTIVCCMRAAWELGANIFNHEYQQGADNVPAFKNFYDFVDVKIVHDDFGFTSDHLYLYINEFNTSVQYPFKKYVLDQPISELTVAVKTHTSGTTGVPKIINYTHRTSIDKTTETIRMHGWVADDVPVHYKTLHHSSLFMDYAIPLLSICRVHHGLEGTYAVTPGEHDDPIVFFNQVMPYIKENKITQMLCPYDWINVLPQANAIDMEAQLSFFTTPGVRQKETLQEVFSLFNLKQIDTGFGTSELGLMCLSKTNKENIDDFEIGRFNVLNQNLEYQLFDTHTKCRFKNDEWITLSDMFEKRDGCLYFKGRNETIIINGCSVNVTLLRNYITYTYKSAFTLVTDFELDCLYLASYDDKIPDDIRIINDTILLSMPEEYSISKFARIDIRQIRRGVKPSNPLLLYYFRTTHK